MANKCPNCGGKVNADDAFCLICGQRLWPDPKPKPTAPQVTPPPQPTPPPWPAAEPEPEPEPVARAWPEPEEHESAPREEWFTPHEQAWPPKSEPDLPRPQPQPQSRPQAQPQAWPQQPPQHLAELDNQMGYGATSTTAVNIWAPFAGYGAKRSHWSLLVNNQGEHALELLSRLRERLRERKTPETYVYTKDLARRGIAAAVRPYELVQRGHVTSGVYIGRLGADLFVSQATFFKGQISSFRILALLVGVAFALIYPLLLRESASGVSIGLGGVSGIADLLGLACCLGPIYLVDWLALALVGLFSLFKFLTEKDLWAAFREPANEFDEDDQAALEQAVEKTIKESLDLIGLSNVELPQPERSSGLGRII